MQHTHTHIPTPREPTNPRAGGFRPLPLQACNCSSPGPSSWTDGAMFFSCALNPHCGRSVPMLPYVINKHSAQTSKPWPCFSTSAASLRFHGLVTSLTIASGCVCSSYLAPASHHQLNRIRATINTSRNIVLNTVSMGTQGNEPSAFKNTHEHIA
jgi:hypothetical protein